MKGKISRDSLLNNKSYHARISGVCVFVVCLAISAFIGGCVYNNDEIDDDSGSIYVGESNTETSIYTEAETSAYKYGDVEKITTLYDDFEPQGEFDDSEPVYKEKNITIVTGFPTGMISPVVTNAVNAYLEEHGYDFTIEFIESDYEYVQDSGFDPHGEVYLRRKEEGLTTDIYMPWLSNMTMEEAYKYMAEEGYALCLDPYLETETGQEILSSMMLFLDDSFTMEDIDELLDLYRLSDGKLYCLPTEMDWTAPYMLYYNNELKDYYDIPDFQGTIEDIYTIEEYADILKDDKVLPLRLEGIDDVAFLNLGGYETYESFWALKHEDDGSVTAVDFFEDETLLGWYEDLGRLCAEGYLSYSPYRTNIQAMDSDIVIPSDQIDYEYIYADFIISQGVIGYCRLNAAGEYNYRVEYDVLDVTTYSGANMALCIDADTKYPEECLEFLALYYGDMDFRNLIYKGPEGWSYYVDDSGEYPVLTYHSSNGGLPMFYGITSSLRTAANMFESFQPRVDTQILATKYMEPATIGWSNDLDFSSIQEKHDACVEIMNKYMYILWGVYGDDTAEKVEELHQMLIDAGYLDVIEYINENL